jgi:hypothetical protein
MFRLICQDLVAMFTLPALAQSSDHQWWFTLAPDSSPGWSVL